ncbi:MAG: class I SAM-dependent methyltransferase [Dehalococcoidia bacterium]
MDRAALLTAWRGEEPQPFAGWDFSYLRGRMLEEQPPWSYADRSAELMRRAPSLVDLDTGGGERLLHLREHWPERVVVTEHYPPNVRLARERLEPLGVAVVDVPSEEGEALPFADGEFDLVLNRQGAFNPAEVARVLAPGGTFLTQQVHSLALHDLLAVFGVQPEGRGSNIDRYVPGLRAGGLTIREAREWEGQVTFTDVGTIVYYLRAVSWLVPGVSVEMHAGRLLALQERVERGEGLTFSTGKELIEAGKG